MLKAFLIGFPLIIIGSIAIEFINGVYSGFGIQTDITIWEVLTAVLFYNYIEQRLQ